MSQSTRDPDHEVSPRGQGNVVSVEFNLLYRWHATISEEDVRWTKNHFAESMPGVDTRTVSTFQVATLMDEINCSKQVSVRDFVTNAVRALDPGGDVTQWTFGGSVVFDFTRRVTLMLGITALVETAAASEMRT